MIKFYVYKHTCPNNKIYIGITAEAARIMKLSQSNVAAVARSERKHTKGYHFEYLSKG